MQPIDRLRIYNLMFLICFLHVSNVQSNPTEEKYRTIRKENKAFKDKVWKFESCQQFLFALGWIEVI